MIPLGKFADRVGNLDFSQAARSAIARDKKLGYPPEDGPHFGIEVVRADAFATYVKEHATAESLHKFSTRQYDCFLNVEATRSKPKKEQAGA